MSRKPFLILLAAMVLFPEVLSAQGNATLANATQIRCTFPLMTVSTWGRDGVEAKTKPPSPVLVQEFEAINTDEGTAQLKAAVGKYDIIVRYAQGYLHFIQAFYNGPLHVTTVLDKKTASGKLKAMHSRHEVTDFALPGFTSSPEQYIGECEILK
jgi:hypothetical protein